ncbi:Delta7-sterol 5-desaturase [Geosmithia morbida]|uniref:Delta7-sterol 5-desaturase n=1 Tax=Geosmithia morbida TaxID=1094350 RepID=A0A9P5CYD0_9HYPO|nr:Delta7-sterol 5-desaturase [Geosmithia morbida]KAF4120273.1 Delta7-sterol 5-desaturase [Geosmithia morbida]
MDIVLEFTDTFIADYVYAWAHPIKPAPYDSLMGIASNYSEAQQTFSPWTFQPASQFISVQPSQAAYMSAWPRDNVFRQLITLYFIVWLFGILVYFFFASLSYVFIFDKRTLDHPKFIKNQVWLEIVQANRAMPVMALCTAPVMVLEVRGYSKLYDTTDEGPGMWYNIAQLPLFLLFTDFCIYWIHRYLHHPLIYKRLHKPHHKWIMPTPYASHAFHPLDGFAQSLPYHIFPFLFPLQKITSVALFAFVNFWSILIHDGEYLTNNPIVNGAACHSLHHSRFEVNYGQFFTAFDRMGGTYRMPEAWMFEAGKKMSKKQWNSESKAVDGLVKEIEGADDRTYEPADTKKNK